MDPSGRRTGEPWVRDLVPELEGGLLLSDIALGIFVVRWAIPWLVYEQSMRFAAASWWLLLLLAWAATALAFTGGGEHLALARIAVYAIVFVAASVTPGLARPLYLLATFFSTGALLYLVSTSMLVIGDPHQFGLLAMAGLAGAQFIRRSSWRKVFSVISAVAIVLCFRRGIWIAGAVEGGILLVPALRRKGGRLRLVLAILLGAMVVGLALSAQEELTERFDLNPESLELREQGGKPRSTRYVSSRCSGLDGAPQATRANRAPTLCWPWLPPSESSEGSCLLASRWPRCCPWPDATAGTRSPPSPSPLGSSYSRLPR